MRSYLDAPEEIYLGRKPDDLLETLVNKVLGSPAICIFRSNGRSIARATSLAKVFVNNFNLPMFPEDHPAFFQDKFLPVHQDNFSAYQYGQ